MTTPVTVQVTHRWVNDDQDLIFATWLGSGNGEDISLQTGTDNRVRIRIRLEETAGGNFILTPNLYFSYDGGAYEPMSTTSDHVRAIASKNTSWTITDDDAITANRLGAGNGAWEDGHFDANGVAETNIGFNSEHTECEYCIYLDDATVADAKLILLRVYDDTAALGSYTDTPQITVDKAAGDPQIDVDADLALGESTTVGALVLPNLSESDDIALADTPTVSVQDATPRTIDEDADLTIGESVTASLDDLVISESDGITIAGVVDGITVEGGAQPDRDIDETDDITIGENVTSTLDDLVLSVSDGLTVGENVNVSDPFEPNIPVDLGIDNLSVWQQGVVIYA